MSLERKILGEQKISISFWVKSRFFFSLKKLFFFNEARKYIREHRALMMAKED